MAVKYASCASSAITYVPTAGSGTTVPAVVYNPLVWQPQSSVDAGNTSFIGGLQCDVYRNSSSSKSNLTLAFVAQRSLPLYKVRLPLCPTSTETINSTCSSAWSFTLEVCGCLPRWVLYTPDSMVCCLREGACSNPMSAQPH